jgi:hypothetical protein
LTRVEHKTLCDVKLILLLLEDMEVEWRGAANALNLEIVLVVDDITHRVSVIWLLDAEPAKLGGL